MRPEVAGLLDELRPFVRDPRVLAAIADVPRELFVRPRDRRRAWVDDALPIGCGQTISQPLVVARMCELLALDGRGRVLDVGTGSGYHAAVLSRLCEHVDSIEVHAVLSARAADALAEAGIANVALHVGDGSRGLPGHGPFDAINVAAATLPGRLGPLLEQLAPGGRLVAPLGDPGLDQVLTVVRRDGRGRLERIAHERVRFVPLVG